MLFLLLIGVKLYKLEQGIIDEDTKTLKGIKLNSKNFELNYINILNKKLESKMNIINLDDLVQKMGINVQDNGENDSKVFQRDGGYYIKISDLRFDKDGYATILFKGVSVTVNKDFLKEMGVLPLEIDKSKIKVVLKKEIGLLGNGLVDIKVMYGKDVWSYKLRLEKYRWERVVGDLR